MKGAVKGKQILLIQSTAKIVQSFEQAMGEQSTHIIS